MTTRKRHDPEMQREALDTPAVPARWEAPGKIETLPPEPDEAIETPSVAAELAREQAVAAEAGAVMTPLVIGEAQAEAEADMIADRGIFHPGGHRKARRGGH